MRLHSGRLAVVPSLLLVLALVLAGCTSFSDTLADEASSPAAASASAEPEAAPIEWSDCNEQIQPLIAGQAGSDRDLAFECGRTEVPISYEEPQGATLPLFLVRAVMAGQTDRIGSLVVNPGGPGASGADAAIGLALTLPEEVLRRFDLVGFDPRGVGLSTHVECIPAELKERLIAAEPRPTSPEELDEAFALAREAAEGCADEYGDALGTFNTVDTARDMDRLRQGLEDEQLTYLGYSYGTTLGSTYAELFPDRVRALVLDAAVDPDADPQSDAEASAAAFEAGFDAFAQNCTKLLAGCPLGAEPRQYVERLLGMADGTPIPSKEKGETRKATAGVVLTAIQAALYDTASWPQLAQSLGTPPGCSPSSTTTPAGWTTTATRTGSMRTWRSTAPTRRRPSTRSRSGRWPPSGTPSTPSSAPLPRPGCTPARCGRRSARRCPSATPRAPRRSSWSATPATR
jgi:pimeloyl-ACP methyl ester carboxylesterase